jgi:hypothetical protein
VSKNIDNLDIDNLRFDNLNFEEENLKENFDLNDYFFNDDVDLKPGQNFKIIVEIKNLENKSEFITKKLIKLHTCLFFHNHILYAKKIEENIQFGWNIMCLRNSWVTNSEEEDWTENQLEQEKGIFHLNEAKMQLSKLYWWINNIIRDSSIKEDNDNTLYADHIIDLLNDVKLISNYFDLFIADKKQILNREN